MGCFCGKVRKRESTYMVILRSYINNKYVLQIQAEELMQDMGAQGRFPSEEENNL